MIVGIDVEAAALGNAGISRYVTCLVNELICDPQDIRELHLFAPRKVSSFDHPLVHWHIHGRSPRTWRMALLLSHLGLASPLTGAPFLDLYHAPDLVFPRKSLTSRTMIVTVHDLTPLTHPETHSNTHTLMTYFFIKILTSSNVSVLTPSHHTRDVLNLFSAPFSSTVRVTPFGTLS